MRKIIPLTKPDINKEDIDNVVKVLKTGMLVQNIKVQELEQKIASYTNSGYVSMVSNGTASLHLALIALNIGEGDEVIVPAFSYIATANVVELVGAKCVFTDIKIETYNIDESKIEEKINKKTKAIMPVHEFGLCANMPNIMEIAKKHNLYVIEDAACAIGASINNQHCGTFGHFGSFSFHPRKAITSGEGGCLITSDNILDKKIKTLRNHGIEPDSYPQNFINAGLNYRLTDIQAALLTGQFKRLDGIISQRQRIAQIYYNEIKNPNIVLPFYFSNTKHTFQSFHILLETNKKRDELLSYLKEKGIASNYGAQCIPAMIYYKNKYKHCSEDEFSNSYKAYKQGLAIPIYAGLKETEAIYISNQINKFK